MNDSGDLMPPAPPEPPAPPVWTGGPQPPADNPAPTGVSGAGASWWSNRWRLLIPAGALVVVGAAAAGVLALAMKPAASVGKMVPASANLLVIANIDPSVTQKVNLMRALHSFPDLKTDKAITDKIDSAFKDSGLNFTSDIQPWLGAEAGFSAQVTVQNTKNLPGALYLVSRDDAKAAAALARLRSGKWGATYQWRDQTYNGITISVGTPKSASQQPGAYAIVDHVVVIASSAVMIDEIIDADQGRAPRLVDTADYKATLSHLPSDRLGWLYINGSSLGSSIKKGIAGGPAVTARTLNGLSDLDALQGIGAAVSANGNGLVGDLSISFNQSKLTPATRQAMARAGHTDTVLRWIPSGSDAFFAFGSLDQVIKSLLDQAGSDPSITATTDAIGLTGSGGLLPHLTGDAGVELEVGSRAIPAGAVLLGTNDPAAMKTFFNKLLAMVGDLSSQSGLSANTGGAAFKTSTYRGVVITSYSGAGLGSLGSALQPSYAVLGGMGILASNVAEMKSVIDAHQAGSNITSDATYKTALAASLKQPSGILFLNVSSLVQAARRFTAEAGSPVTTKDLASLTPVKAIMLTAAGSADSAVERLFVVIQ